MSVVYATEPLNPELRHEIDSMLADYYEATVAKDGIPPYDFDWAMYVYLQEMDMLLVATARDEAQTNALVGVALYHVTPMPHHRGLIAAECDSICTAHTHRGKGIGKGLYRFVEPLLVARGVNRIINRYRLCYGARPMFEDLGFSVEEHVYVKRVM